DPERGPGPAGVAVTARAEQHAGAARLLSGRHRLPAQRAGFGPAPEVHRLRREQPDGFGRYEMPSIGKRASAKHELREAREVRRDRKSTRLNSSHDQISYAVFCLKKK